MLSPERTLSFQVNLIGAEICSLAQCVQNWGQHFVKLSQVLDWSTGAVQVALDEMNGTVWSFKLFGPVVFEDGAVACKHEQDREAAHDEECL